MFKFRPSTTQSSLSSGHASIQQCQEIDSTVNESSDELTIESMSAVIAAAVQISSAGGQPSSLSLGNASILQPFSQLEKQKNQRYSFWPTRKSKPPKPAVPALDANTEEEETDEDTQTPRQSSSCVLDDGRDELVYRGIQIKEVKTTLKTLVIPDQISHPMPEVKLERPSFARVSY